MYDLYYGNNMFGWGFGGIMMVIFWFAVIWFIVWAVRGTYGSDSEKTHSKSALDILKERYAKGDIDKKEFEEKKKDLSG